MNLEVLFSKKQIKEKVNKLAQEINDIYSSDTDLVVVCILKGAFIFYSDLLKQLNQNVLCDFCSLSFYGGNKEVSNPARLTLDIKTVIKDKDVLLVDCMSDKGYSFNFARQILEFRNPKSIKTACLVFKPLAVKNAKIDFKGFEVEQDCFVVGYGIDYKAQYRQLDYFARVVE
ncbi:MAG: hypoxanthine phosphoribosyltransferase [Bdellovibrionales bacterium]|nr:hypoxanthine phosphoribosyltransferase [Bdellovibrionales bacterium]